jgi:hypothetical protein
MTPTSPTNPYEPPREPAPRSVPDFSDRDAAELADLRQRVAELEKRVGRSWLVHRNFFVRLITVWGYFFLGYMILLAAMFGIMAIMSAFAGDWP